MKIRVGVNLLGIQRGRSGGVETYVRELLAELQSIPDLQLVLFTSQVNHELFAEYENVERVLCPVRGTRLGLRVVFEQTLLSAKARRHGCRLLFCPGYLSPVFPLLPTVVAIHDMNFRDIPGTFTRTRRWLQEAVIPRASRRARAVLTLSKFSRGRILQHLALNPAKVHVIPLAARTFERTVSVPAETLQRLSLPDHFVVSVSGSSPPHKNIARLCRAFQRARTSFTSPWGLICIGPKPATLASLGLNGDHEGIRFPGFVDDGELAAIYRRAEGFVLPSLYEGFGLPALEAMHAGLPVACSNAASLPEVVGEAALQFNPLSEESIAGALGRMVNDPALRQQLRLAGAANVKRFSWPRCAAATAQVFRAVVDRAE